MEKPSHLGTAAGDQQGYSTVPEMALDECVLATKPSNLHSAGWIQA